MDVDADVLIIKGQVNHTLLNNIKKAVIEGQKSESLYLILDTPGGDASVGFRTMCLLNKKYKKISVIVPNWAMSTGTLMALGGDIIYMFYSSSLGPLDLQIEHPNDGSGISALDVRDAWTTILTISDFVATTTFNKAIEEYNLSKVQAATHAGKYSIDFVKPILDKIDPYHLQSRYRSSAVGSKYATTLLKARMLRLSPFHAEKVGKRLSDQYETHGTAITLDEARDELGLNVEDLSNLEAWPSIETLYNTAVNGVTLNYLKKPKSEKMENTSKKEKKV